MPETRTRSTRLRCLIENLLRDEVALIRGQKVRVVRDVNTHYFDSRFEYAGMDYDEYARLHEPHVLRAGSIARFDGYAAPTMIVGVITEGRVPTDLCEVILGRERFWLARVPTDSLEACEPGMELTPLQACVDLAGLPLDHHFRTDR